MLAARLPSSDSVVSTPSTSTFTSASVTRASSSPVSIASAEAELAADLGVAVLAAAADVLPVLLLLRPFPALLIARYVFTLLARSCRPEAVCGKDKVETRVRAAWKGDGEVFLIVMHGRS